MHPSLRKYTSMLSCYMKRLCDIKFFLLSENLPKWTYPQIQCKLFVFSWISILHGIFLLFTFLTFHWWECISRLSTITKRITYIELSNNHINSHQGKAKQNFMSFVKRSIDFKSRIITYLKNMIPIIKYFAKN